MSQANEEPVRGKESSSHRNIHRCRLKLHQAEKKPDVTMIQELCRLLWTEAHLRRTEAERKLFWGQMDQNLTLQPPD